MIFKNRLEKYNILFKSNLTVPDIAKILDVSESTVLKARMKLVGDVVGVNNKAEKQYAHSLNKIELNGKSNLGNESDLGKDDLDSLTRNAICEAYKLEGERDSFYKFFYKIANSYINSHFKYKEIKLGAAFKKLVGLNNQILNLEREIKEVGIREIISVDDSNLCRKLKLDLKFKIYKRNRLAKKLILNDMKEDYDCLVKLKEIFKSRDLKLGKT
ncbi:hypothetical protein DB313_04650 (plasmid) [Borrelia turcica IST7]|uniref:Uncharacterized protein n=1 Tax=Borrelia turcica IST7 TaxID=1104446 RepID=A0A386PMI0_9SPIR|nr:hypothetical protein [Borrelia turcica]AYE36791.1 hypothetical protein DB313_04650 [Borrelia turcica IST7]